MLGPGRRGTTSAEASTEAARDSLLGKGHPGVSSSHRCMAESCVMELEEISSTGAGVASYPGGALGEAMLL